MINHFYPDRHGLFRDDSASVPNPNPNPRRSQGMRVTEWFDEDENDGIRSHQISNQSKRSLSDVLDQNPLDTDTETRLTFISYSLFFKGANNSGADYKTHSLLEDES